MLAVDPLDEQVNSAAVALTPPHVFEIVTSSVTYYVGVDMTGFSPSDLKPSSNNDDEGSSNVLYAWWHPSQQLVWHLRTNTWYVNAHNF